MQSFFCGLVVWWFLFTNLLILRINRYWQTLSVLCEVNVARQVLHNSVELSSSRSLSHRLLFSLAASSFTHAGFQDWADQDGNVQLQPQQASQPHLQHDLEVGEGLDHRCVVCEHNHRSFQKTHPVGTPNPFKRKKTRYRCGVCQVYLCKWRERPCWQIWHKES